MTEPRMRQRHKGQQFETSELAALLFAFGDTSSLSDNASGAPLQSTIQILDSILTDFIIETCHGAALSASYSRRQKIKVEDFKWVLRNDKRKLGRVLSMIQKEKELKKDRKLVDADNMAEEEAKRLADEGVESGRRKRRRVE
ncbi:hypothetical protein LTR66_001590 [Elasticomyces elasticus]|nr:hypothetical protein LTR50_005170 [Elasticomyces elasticus]KAK4999344.1 hypothetical protein LTR66_001590 [Elasticomyces elasticus]